MRDIKFRAWDLYQNKMLDWSEVSDCQKLTLSNLLNGLIDHIIPMQYTGLKDKNKDGIYEGDIVSVVNNDFTKGVYEIEFKGAGFWFKDVDEAELYVFDQAGYIIEIIGNIYEHPELLKVKK